MPSVKKIFTMLFKKTPKKPPVNNDFVRSWTGTAKKATGPSIHGNGFGYKGKPPLKPTATTSSGVHPTEVKHVPPATPKKPVTGNTAAQPTAHTPTPKKPVTGNTGAHPTPHPTNTAHVSTNSHVPPTSTASHATGAHPTTQSTIVKKGNYYDKSLDSEERLKNFKLLETDNPTVINGKLSAEDIGLGLRYGGTSNIFDKMSGAPSDIRAIPDKEYLTDQFYTQGREKWARCYDPTSDVTAVIYRMNDNGTGFSGILIPGKLSKADAKEICNMFFCKHYDIYEHPIPEKFTVEQWNATRAEIAEFLNNGGKKVVAKPTEIPTATHVSPEATTPHTSATPGIHSPVSSNLSESFGKDLTDKNMQLAVKFTFQEVEKRLGAGESASELLDQICPIVANTLNIDRQALYDYMKLHTFESYGKLYTR